MMAPVPERERTTPAGPAPGARPRVSLPSSTAMPGPVFIVGNDRSGTTMLRLILDRGPDVAIPPESMFLTDFAPTFANGEPSTPEATTRLMQQIWEHPKVRLWDLPGTPPRVPPELNGQDAYRFI